MKAIQTKPQGGIQIRDVPVPEPTFGQVLVKVAGTGLCHSDCMISKYPTVYRPDGTPFTLGHEVAGTIASLGEGVRTLSLNQPVIVHAEWGCGQCSTCRAGAERMCPVVKPAAGCGMGFDGGLAEYVLVPAARNVLPLPANLNPVDAGPLDDAALTPYHAIVNSLPWLEAGSVAVVIGAGGLGHMAIQILRALCPATVVVIEKDAHRRAFALEIGADAALDPQDDVAARIADRGRRGASFVLDLVGSDDTLNLAASIVSQRGKVVCAGAGMGAFPFSIISAPWECIFQTSYSGEARELEQVLALAAAGRLRVETHHITLDEVPEAYQRIDCGDHGLGRMIAVPTR